MESNRWGRNHRRKLSVLGLAGLFCLGLWLFNGMAREKAHAASPLMGQNESFIAANQFWQTSAIYVQQRQANGKYTPLYLVKWWNLNGTSAQHADWSRRIRQNMDAYKAAYPAPQYLFYLWERFGNVSPPSVLR